jgi:hypothetical protein
VDVRVILQGGLGNQLFQLLSALALAGTGNRVVVDTVLLQRPSRRLARSSVTPRAFECERLVAALGWRVRRNRTVPPEAYHRIANLLAVRAPSLRLGPLALVTGAGIRTYRASGADAVLGAHIRRLYRLPAEPVERQSVHVRLGDYRSLEHVYGPPDARYYRDAMDAAFVAGQPVAVFSDDLPEALAWLQERFPGFRFRSAASFDWPPVPSSGSWTDLLRMAVSRRLVVANSTYSWWSAWLAWQCYARSGLAHVAPASMHPTGLPAPVGAKGLPWSWDG